MDSATLNYGQEIAKLRKKAKISQALLANYIGVSSQQISNIERGGSVSRDLFILALNKLGYRLQEKIVRIQ